MSFCGGNLFLLIATLLFFKLKQFSLSILPTSNSHHALPEYNKIQGLPCDSFYIRSNFDRVGESDQELSFHKDEILYVENSLYKNQLGKWYAWLVDDKGNKLKGGIIPSRIK